MQETAVQEKIEQRPGEEIKAGLGELQIMRLLQYVADRLKFTHKFYTKGRFKGLRETQSWKSFHLAKSWKYDKGDFAFLFPILLSRIASPLPLESLPLIAAEIEIFIQGIETRITPDSFYWVFKKQNAE